MGIFDWILSALRINKNTELEIQVLFPSGKITLFRGISRPQVGISFILLKMSEAPVVWENAQEQHR